MKIGELYISLRAPSERCMSLMCEKILLKKIVHYISYEPVLFFYNYLTPTDPKYLRNPIIPYLHQVDLFSRLQLRRPIRILIGDEIGLGKTIEAIAILRYLEVKKEVSRILILTPKMLINQWKDELRRAGVGYFDIKEIVRKNIKTLERENFRDPYYIASIDLIKREEHKNIIKAVGWDAIVVDEVHNAGHSTRRWGLIKELVCGDESRKRHVLLLSATPHRGDSLDYLYRLYLLDPYLSEEKIKKGELDNRDFYRLTHGSILFRRTKELVNRLESKKVFTNCNFYALAVQPTKDELEFSHLLVNFLRDKVSLVYGEGPSPAALLAVLVRKRASSSPNAAIKTLSHILQGLSERVPIGEVSISEYEEDIESILGIDYGEMEEIDLDLDEVVEKLVEKCVSILDMADERTVRTLIEIANKIKIDDSKLNAVANIVDKYLRDGKKVIIFTEYRDTLDYLKASFLKLTDRYGDGFFETISGKDKDRFEEVKEKFSGDKCNLLIATDVASEGLNLQVANIVINYEAPWSPIKLEQRMGRVWRIGQKLDVNIYTTFLGTDADVDIMQNLYAKLLVMKDALDEVKPLLGEAVQIAYRATATASEGLWKTRNVEFTEIELEGKKEKINEFRLILASLKGTLSQYVESLLYLLARVHEELSKKSVYPYVNPNEIEINLVKRISSKTVKDYEDCSRRLCEIVCKKFGVESYKHAICKTENLQKIWELINGELKNVEWDLKNNNFFTPIVKPNNISYLFLVETKLNGKTVYEELILYDKLMEKIIYGAELFKYLLNLFDSYLIPCSLEIGDKQFDFDIGIGEDAKIKRECRERYEKAINEVAEYIYKTKNYRTEEKPVVKYNIDLKKYATFIGIETEPEIIPEDVKKKIEEAAMKFVMQKEIDEGMKPDDTPSRRNEHYDIYSYHPRTGEERFIEVKGHAGMQIFAELTEEEFLFGKEKKDKYWLYLVFNLTNTGDLTKAKYLRFRDPVNTLKIITKKHARYVLSP
ncbi:MAG: helicase-related protein [Candidatus Micrarchaeaceae archaeon]